MDKIECSKINESVYMTKDNECLCINLIIDSTLKRKYWKCKKDGVICYLNTTCEEDNFYPITFV